MRLLVQWEKGRIQDFKSNPKTHYVAAYDDQYAIVDLQFAHLRGLLNLLSSLRTVIVDKNVTSRKTNVLTKFHDDWTKNVTSRVFTCFAYINIEKTAPLPGGYVFSPIWTIFELAIIVTSRMFTRKTAPPTGGNVFQRTGTTFELNQHIIKTNILTNFELDRGIIGTNLLTKFHEDRTRNVASRVFTNQM
ncbi:hypothetical protein DPMN_111916 [Dreissena polymorpha]|uniref:Uncharacterized protein n=1 Tax=Dreissena polymorpha TaxID=45954 RepID=A0A9D4KF56_DREPO|nr:hypothetical protein DPMN_111916 [Dreissena polymorpha]